MGTSGNRPGYKVFSISTTIRNPKRNADFLTAFQAFDGQRLFMMASVISLWDRPFPQ